MKLNDKHRSLIASAFVGGYDEDHTKGKNRSLCCAPDALKACVAIVGKRNAEKLRWLFYNELGCGGWDDAAFHAAQEQYFLDKIAALEAL